MPVRVLWFGERADALALVREAVAPLPGVEIVQPAPGVRLSDVPDAVLAVFDAPDGTADAHRLLRELRASGHQAAAVIVCASAAGEPAPGETPGVGLTGATPATAGATGLTWEQLPEALPTLVASAAAARDGEQAPAMRALRRMQQLMASGAIAHEVQHSANNPLTALLAEAQLLEMEPLEGEMAAAVQRIVELTRRVAEALRGLDALRRR